MYILFIYIIYIIYCIYYYIGKLVIKLNQSNHLKTQAKGTTEEALQRLSLATPALVESRDRRGEALVESSISWCPVFFFSKVKICSGGILITSWQ